jgi:hypothetical protein
LVSNGRAPVGFSEREREWWGSEGEWLADGVLVLLLGSGSLPIGGWRWCVREREGGEEIMARLPRVSPLPCVHWLEHKENKREKEMPAGEREVAG